MTNTLLIFFALPIATIIISIALQKLLRSPILVAAVIFAIFLIVAFTAFDETFLVAAIIYTIIAYITALLTCIISRIIRRINNCNCNNNCSCNNNCRCRNNGSNNTDSLTDNNIVGNNNILSTNEIVTDNPFSDNLLTISNIGNNNKK